MAPTLIARAIGESEGAQTPPRTQINLSVHNSRSSQDNIPFAFQEAELSTIPVLATESQDPNYFFETYVLPELVGGRR